MKSILLASAALFIVIVQSSCVAKSKLTAAQAEISRLQLDSAQLQSNLQKLQTDIASARATLDQMQQNKQTLQGELDALQKRLDETRSNASRLLSNSQQTIEEQQKRLQQLQALIDQQRNQTEQLRRKMADALTNFNANELTVATKNGKVYVSLSENLLFPSGSAVVNPKGKQALGQLAQVLNNNPDIRVNIEGHTDTVPIRGKYEDNWALSVSRATAIVRILTHDYKVDPTRIVASGRSQYEPLDVNYTAQGRARNRRTEIILEPNLDELMKLLGNTDQAGDQQRQ